MGDIRKKEYVFGKIFRKVSENNNKFSYTPLIELRAEARPAR